MTEKTLAWHFLQDDYRLRWGTKEVVEAGKTYSCEWPYEFEGVTYDIPTLCKAGMHGSEQIINALNCAPGAICCRVEIWGDVARGYDKLVGRYRRVLAMADVTMVLHEFSCRCAEHAMRRYGNNDPSSWAVIDAKRRWMRGEIDADELSTAESAAWSSVRSAAWSSVRSAAWSAAWYAAWSAARSARNVVWSAQNRLLTAMVSKELGL